MQTLLGAHKMSDAVLKQLWINKLDTDTTQILAVLTDDVDLEKLAAIVDRISDTKPMHRISLVQSAELTTTSTERQISLTAEIKKLHTRLDDMQKRQSRSYDSNRRNVFSTKQIFVSSHQGPPYWHMLVPRGFWRESKTLSAAMFVQQCLESHSVGKSSASCPLKTLDTGRGKLNRLFYIQDSNNHLRFLIDTGAQVSVIPKTSIKSMQLRESMLKLQAANGTSIKPTATSSLN